AYSKDIDSWIIKYLKEGMGIRSISRILEISTNTVTSRIITIANSIKHPLIAKGKDYEFDELRTFIRNKQNVYWVIYAIRQDTREVVDFVVGKRNNINLKSVLNSLLLSDAKKIFTDKLR